LNVRPCANDGSGLKLSAVRVVVKVHVEIPGCRLHPVTVQLGLTDGAATEVLGESLTQGQPLALAPYYAPPAFWLKRRG